VPAYKLARQQKEVVLKPAQVEIKEFEILEVEIDRARFRARVASGTYMRSVAHEMGRELACGAHLESLRRTSVAEFNLEDAHTLEDVATATRSAAPDGRNDASPLDDLFMHPRNLLPQLPSVTADEPTAARIRSGRTVNLPDLSRARQIKVFSGQRELIAIATRVAGTLFHPKIVLCGMETPVR
jgi:tRNA pseudouridine55 synthase